MASPTFNFLEDFIRGRAAAEDMAGAQQQREFQKEREKTLQAQIREELKRQKIINEMAAIEAQESVRQQFVSGQRPLPGQNISFPSIPGAFAGGETFIPSEEQFEIPLGEELGSVNIDPRDIFETRNQIREQLRASGQQKAEQTGLERGAEVAVEAPLRAELAAIQQLGGIARARETTEGRTGVELLQQKFERGFRETPEQRREREESVARIRRSATEGATSEDLGIIADDLSMGRINFTSVPTRQRLAARTELAKRGEVPVGPNQIKALNEFTNLVGLISDAKEFISNLPEDSKLYASIQSKVETVKNFFGMSTLSDVYETIKSRGGQIAAAIGQEVGRKTEGDIIRALGSLPRLGLTRKESLARIIKIEKDFNRIVNGILAGVPQKQKDRIFSNFQYTPTQNTPTSEEIIEIGGRKFRKIGVK